MSVRFCLSYDLLNVGKSRSKPVFFMEICVVVRTSTRNDVTCSHQKYEIMCGYNIIYNMTSRVIH